MDKYSTYSGVGSVLTYAKTLTDQLYSVNGIVFVLTDGDDNASKTTPKMIRDMKGKTLKNEEIESIVDILVGINVTDTSCKQFLDKFSKDADFTQYVDAGNADKNTLAKLAQFVSKSISSQSQSLGTGNSTPVMTF